MWHILREAPTVGLLGFQVRPSEYLLDTRERWSNRTSFSCVFCSLVNYFIMWRNWQPLRRMSSDLQLQVPFSFWSWPCPTECCEAASSPLPPGCFYNPCLKQLPKPFFLSVQLVNCVVQIFFRLYFSFKTSKLVGRRLLWGWTCTAAPVIFTVLVPGGAGLNRRGQHGRGTRGSQPV